MLTVCVQDAVDIVAAHISKGATAACKALIEAATARWREEEGDYRDDVLHILYMLSILYCTVF